MTQARAITQTRPKVGDDGQRCAVLGAALQFAPLLGTWNMGLGQLYVLTFNFGYSQRSLLTEVIALLLFLSFVVGFIAGFYGLALMAKARNRYDYQPRWFNVYTATTPLLWLLAYPIGTIVGVVLILGILCVLCRPSQTHRQ